MTTPSSRYLRGFSLGIVPVAFLLAAHTAQADGTQTLLKELLTSETPQFGEDVRYRLTSACNSLTSDCGNLSITDTLPTGMELASCDAPNGFTVSCPAGGNTFTISKDTVFNGGDSFIFNITTRIDLGTNVNESLVNTATATITAPDTPENASIDATATAVTVAAPTLKWELRKQRTSPSTNLDPTWDTDVSYRVQLCSLTAAGNVSITGAQLIDTFPANATFVTADATHTVNANQITWDLGDLDIATLYNGQDFSAEQCISKNYTLRYPDASFDDGDTIDNTLSAQGTPSHGVVCDGTPGTGNCLPVTLTETIGIPTPGADLNKWANDILTGAAGSPMSWTLDADVDNSNAPVPDLVIYEKIPITPAGMTVESVTSGQWNSPPTTQAPAGSDVRATIGYATAATFNTSCDDGATTYTDLATTIASPASNSSYDLSGQTDVRCIRWQFTDQGADGPAVPRGWEFTTRPQLRLNTENVAGPYPVQVQNCMQATYTNADLTTGSTGDMCRTANIEEPTPEIDVVKYIDPSSAQPGDEVQVRLRIYHDTADSTAATINPVMADLLPDMMEFVRWDSVNLPDGKAEPNLEVIDDYGSTGRTLLRFSWSDTPPANAVRLDGSAAVANAESFEEGHNVNIYFTVKIAAGTPASNYSNEVVFFDNSPRFTCRDSGDVGVDSNDLDGDSDSAEPICRHSRSLTVESAAVLSGEKWVKGDHPTLINVDDPITSPAVSNDQCPDDGNGYTRYPCTAQTQHGGEFNYVLKLENTGNEALNDYIVYDVLPDNSDTGVGEPLSTQQRGTVWQPQLKEALVALDVYTQGIMAQTGSVIEYSVSDNPCRPEVSASATETPADHWQAGCTDDWTNSPADFSAVTAFRIKLPFTDAPHWEPAETLQFQVNMIAPADAPPSILDDANHFNPAWNSFAHRVTQQSNGARLGTAEPRQVGIVLPPAYRIGNLVWFDVNGNGSAEDGENGLQNVQLSVYEDTNTNGTADDGDTKIADATTDANGHYAFNNLDAGDYYVMVIDPSAQAPLNGFFSSTQGEEATANDDGDNNDNGVNTVTVSGVTGLVSSMITLGPEGSEPTNEVIRQGQGDSDNDDYPDQLSNYSVDFGFSAPRDFADAPESYATLEAASGANHVLTNNVYLGACVDDETDGQPNVTADGDDNGVAASSTIGVCATANDDEDSLTPPIFNDGVSGLQLTINTHNSSGADATVACWVDYDGSGTFEDTAAERAETIVATGVTSVALTLPDVPATASTDTGGSAYMRCRIAQNAAHVANATGLALSGEVEDYVVNFAPACSLNAPAINAVCANNGTAADASDDTFSYTINTTGTGVGASYSISGGDTQSALAYDNDQGPFGTFPISGGNLSLTLTDVDAASCMLADVIVTAPATCSALANTADVTLNKSVSTNQASPGDTVVYTLSVTNDGPVTATGVEISDPLPTGVTYVSDNSGGAYVSATGIWTVGDLANGITAHLEITVTID